jgi:hypothetical protein
MERPRQEHFLLKMSIISIDFTVRRLSLNKEQTPKTLSAMQGHKHEIGNQVIS